MDLNNIKFKSEFLTHYRHGEGLAECDGTKYHYTSATALKSILSETSKIRMTDIRFMNDHSEMVYFVKCFLQYLLDNIDSYPFCWKIINDLLIKDYSVDDYLKLLPTRVLFNNSISYSLYESHRIFALCLSDVPDSLNMWNYYSKDGNCEGYNIGFDIYKFLESFDIDGESENCYSDIIFGNVLYKKDEQEKEIKEIADSIEEVGNSDNDDIFMLSQILLRCKIESIGPFFKDIAFENEREFRILFCVDNNNLKNPQQSFNNEFLKRIQLDYYVRKGILVPALYVPFKKEAVTSVTVPPTAEKELAQLSLSEFLSSNGYNAEICFSNIPIRF